MTQTIELTNVSLKFGRFEALRDISLVLESGKIHGLLGRNGAGKTSLLSLIAALREPTRGQIEIGGKPVFENAALMQQIALIYGRDYKDEYDKIPELLEFSERYRPNFDRSYAERLMKRFRLPLDKPVNKLSKGMQAALNVTIGLAGRTPITIFDEVYLGMDAPAREIFYEEVLNDHAEHPRTMILSTHLVSEMDRLFENVVILKNGRLLLNEPYEDLISRGISVTGTAEAVDAFTAGMDVLNEQRLGGTKSITVFGELTDAQFREARELGLEIGPVALQDLFIHLTKEED